MENIKNNNVPEAKIRRSLEMSIRIKILYHRILIAQALAMIGILKICMVGIRIGKAITIGIMKSRFYYMAAAVYWYSKYQHQLFVNFMLRRTKR